VASANSYRVGFLGSGGVTQAIHLPVLATMPDLWKVAAVMDANTDLAAAIAARCGAFSTNSADALIEDPTIDVIAICSPNRFHAQQVVAACRAGKRAVLCEKPLAIDGEESDLIMAAATESGTQVLVGTMHAYDPAYRHALAAWQQNAVGATNITSSIYLPPNHVFIDIATETASVPPISAAPAAPTADGLAHERMMLRSSILGLAIHDLPLVRTFMPMVGDVLAARRQVPFGYSIILADPARACIAELNAYVAGDWPPDWTFRAANRHRSLEISFPPAYVLAGSAEARLSGPGQSLSFHEKRNGYEEQWRHLHDILAGKAKPLIPLADTIADLDFAIEIAGKSAAVLDANA
jgi:predicted dehydrogenase